MTLSQSSIDSPVGDGQAARACAAASEAAPGADIQRILHLSVPLSVTLAERTMAVESILDITVGTIIEFEVSFDAPLALSVASHVIGQGHAVKAGEHFGLRITTIGTVHQRIDAMGSD